MVRVRKNVLTLAPDGPELTWYSRAVAEMRKRPADDPLSWAYQANVHGTISPPPAAQRNFWRQCQHQTWFFLPWHRGYLVIFEEVVAKFVADLGGPADWALPYWNYSAPDPNALLLPAAFVPSNLADGSDNPLWAQRGSPGADVNLGPEDVDLGALTDNHFVGGAGGASPGFGGPQTGFSHAGGVNGDLENVPHNAVHGTIGGLMGDPRTAAQDPVFWLHHANIDRLWEVWIKRDNANKNPTLNAWLTGTAFQLQDSAGGVYKFSSKDVMDTKVLRHGYIYDDVSDPVRTNVALRNTVMTKGLAGTQAMAAQAQPQLIAAGGVGMTLGDAPATAVLNVDRHAQPGVNTAFAATRPPRVFLNLENVTAEERRLGKLWRLRRRAYPARGAAARTRICRAVDAVRRRCGFGPRGSARRQRRDVGDRNYRHRQSSEGGRLVDLRAAIDHFPAPRHEPGGRGQSSAS